MKLIELLKEQRLTIQLLWGEQKIEFFSNVIDKDEASVYVTPYIHNGSELELNVVQGKGVTCNIFTIDPSTKHRISWKNIEFTTVTRDDKIMYCLKTNGYNHVAKHDDRRLHDRMIIHVKGKVFDGQSKEGVDIIVHDISDIGISFYAPKTYAPKSHQLDVIFSEIIHGKELNINVECTIVRAASRAGNQFVGCKITKENKDYQLYGFIKRLSTKNKNKISKPEGGELSEGEQGEIPEEINPEGEE